MRSAETITPGELRAEIARDLATRGYSIQHVSVDDDPEAPIRWFIDQVGLGEPYVPVLYREQVTQAFARPVVAISTGTGSGHPAFTTCQATPLHTDGTLEVLGAVRTSLLHCHRPAAEGGESHIFGLAAAIEQLAQRDAAAAETLFMPSVLRRWSTFEGARLSRVDAVAAPRGGRLVVRFSDRETDEWLPPPGRERDFERARAWLAEMARPGSPLFVTLRLAQGDILVLANDQVAHGRGPYRDDPMAPRCLFRALFLEDLRA